jgi:hypothetical protein
MADKSLDTLINELKEFESDSGRSSLNRTNLLELLRIIHDNLSEICGERYTDNGDLDIILLSPAVCLLGKFIEALSDLDIGKSDDVFKPYDNGANATLSWNDRQVWEMLITGVDTVKASAQMLEQAAGGGRASLTNKAAVSKVAGALRELGATWRGKEIDDRIMLTVYNNRRKSNNWIRRNLPPVDLRRS